MMNAHKAIIFFIPLLGVLLSCNGNNSDHKTGVQKEDKDVVLANVNGTQITQMDLQQSLYGFLGEYQARHLNEANRQKALQSLVMSRVISQTAEKEIAAEDQLKLEKRVNAHREKLLVNYYLRKHADIKPVTEQEIKEYYDKNPEKYGASKARSYEMIFGKNKLTLEQRNQIIRGLKKIEKVKKWNKKTQSMRKKGIDLHYRQGDADESLLDTRLKNLIASLKLNETSQLTFLKGKPYVVRISREQVRPARPLIEVKSEINKLLGARQLKSAIQKTSDKLMKAAKIEYIK